MKPFTKYHYLLSFLLPLATLTSLLLGSWYIYLPLLNIALFPLLDLALGRSRTQARGNRGFFHGVLYAHAVLYTILIITFLIVISHIPLSLAWFVIVWNVGMCGLISAVAAGHELIHSQDALSRRFGLLLFTLTNYNHFAIEHLKAHHAFVATSADAATARRSESLLAFYLRTIPGQYMDVVRRSIANAATRRKFLSYTLLEVLMWATILSFFGAAVFIAWLVMSSVTIIGLEYANYIRHWGLERTAGEAISPLHAWQSDAVWSRAIFLDLPVHSDHHLSAKPYQDLQFFDTNRYLPSGYYATFWVAFFPPVWKRVMLTKIQGT